MVHIIPVQPTLDTNAYATGDVIGGKITLVGAAAQNGFVLSINIFDADGENDQLDFFFFNADLTGTSGYTDNAAFAVNAADMSNLVGAVSVIAADYIAAGSDSVATKSNINIPFRATQSGNLYVIMVIRATTTYTAASDLRLTFGIM
jgi:hypothetical protein